MSRRKTTVSLLAACLIATSAAIVPVLATETGSKQVDRVAEATRPKDETAASLLKLSNEGYQAMRGIRAARIAIFNGQPELATTMLDEASEALTLARKDAPDYAVKSQVSIGGKVIEREDESGRLDLVPVDAQVAIADTFVSTPEKQEHIAKANEHFTSGEHEKAIEELKLGEIDISYMRILMPLTSTLDHVDNALAMVRDGKYYEANLVLKAAEAGYQYDTILLETPMSLTSGTDHAADAAGGTDHAADVAGGKAE